jgi:hypothetical protein
VTEEQQAGSGDNGAGAAAREQASDALGHFWRAAHELLQAARTVIDAADQLVDEQMAAKRDEQATRIRRIDVE